LWINKITLGTHAKENTELRRDAQNAVNQIKRIKYFADQKAIPLFVALLPDEKQINPALQKKIIPPEQRDLYDFSMPQAMLTSMFNDLGLRTIDLLPAFLESSDCLYMNDTHFSPEGQSLAAAIIAREIAGSIR
jgi:hypothetical protein